MAICPFRCPKMSVNDGIDSHISRTSYRSSLWCALAVRLAVASRQGGPGQRRRVPSTSVSLFSARHLARITFDGPSSYQLQAPSYRSPHVPLFSQDFTYATDTCPFSALEDPPAQPDREGACRLQSAGGQLAPHGGTSAFTWLNAEIHSSDPAYRGGTSNPRFKADRSE